MTPTLYEWMGGAPAIARLMTAFYAAIAEDPLLGPVFAHASPTHVTHVAAFVAEVLGGPAVYSEHHGGHAEMIRHHLGRSLDEAQRKRWVDLLLAAADQQGIADDPEFRSALVGYLEWGSRLAVINSRSGATTAEPAAMPRWGWGEVRGPYVAPGDAQKAASP